MRIVKSIGHTGNTALLPKEITNSKERFSFGIEIEIVRATGIFGKLNSAMF
jgi:hypothetical protein